MRGIVFMQKYLYLTKIEWVDAWENGGEIPISLASKYKSDQRGGKMTPDENLINNSPIDLAEYSPFLDVENASIKSLTITGNEVNGRSMPEVIDVQHFKEDGLILSFCNIACEAIAKQLGKEACIKIYDIQKLKEIIDQQVGSVGIMNECKYTADHQRDHFLKSDKDAWQKEYRLFWDYQKEVTVKIPKGLAICCGKYSS